MRNVGIEDHATPCFLPSFLETKQRNRLNWTLTEWNNANDDLNETNQTGNVCLILTVTVSKIVKFTVFCEDLLLWCVVREGDNAHHCQLGMSRKLAKCYFLRRRGRRKLREEQCETGKRLQKPCAYLLFWHCIVKLEMDSLGTAPVSWMTITYGSYTYCGCMSNGCEAKPFPVASCTCNSITKLYVCTSASRATSSAGDCRLTRPRIDCSWKLQ